MHGNINLMFNAGKIKDGVIMKKLCLKKYSLILTVILIFVSTLYCGIAASQIKVAKSLPRLVDVGADSCLPCVMMAPILEDLANEYKGILEVEFVDVRKNTDAARKYNIRGIPTQIFFDASGKELGRHLGYMTKEKIIQYFKKFGVELKNPQQNKKK